jgi:glutamate-1-semialdehyde 2,1-aminomutase
MYHRGKGSRVWDVDGNEYIDYFLGNGPLILGHCHDEVMSEVFDQLKRGSNLGGHTNVSLTFGQKICDTYKNIDRFRYTTTGTEATLYAMRIARAYTGRDFILRFEGAYHGHHDLALMSTKMRNAPSNLKDTSIPDTRPFVDSAGIPQDVSEKVIIAPFNNIKRVKEIFEWMGQRIACVIVEPVQRYIAPQNNFLQEVYEVAHTNGSLVVFDEIVTGFRIAPGGAQEYYKANADLTTLGKITGGGFPHGVVGGTAEVMDRVFDSFSDNFVFHAGTFSGNAAACTAGFAQVTILERDNLYERLHTLGQRIRKGVAEVLAGTGRPYRVSGVGPMWHFAFIDRDIVDYRSSLFADTAIMGHIITKMYLKGVLCSAGRNYLSAVHSDSDIDRTIEILQEAVYETMKEIE